MMIDMKRMKVKLFRFGATHPHRPECVHYATERFDFVTVNTYHPHVFGTTNRVSPRAEEKMFKAVFLQLGATILATLIAGLIIGSRGALSAALGGAACVLPNLLFVLRLAGGERRPAAAYPVVFFVGEIIKIAATVGLLATVRLVYPDVHWLALFCGLVVALKANLFALLVKN